MNPNPTDGHTLPPTPPPSDGGAGFDQVNEFQVTDRSLVLLALEVTMLPLTDQFAPVKLWLENIDGATTPDVVGHVESCIEDTTETIRSQGTEDTVPPIFSSEHRDDGSSITYIQIGDENNSEIQSEPQSLPSSWRSGSQAKDNGSLKEHDKRDSVMNGVTFSR